MFEDNFDRAAIGERWHTTGEGFEIQNGRLQLQELKNHPVWLTQPLPDEYQLEFDAWALSDEGDIKFEIAGDGHSFAKTVSYTPSGYVLVFGGWSNRLHVIAKQDEHADDRAAKNGPEVQARQRYQFVVQKRKNTISWHVDGRLLLEFEDSRPLLGKEQRYFGFNAWKAPIAFDNLVIRRLAPAG